MKNLAFLLFVIPLFASAQISDHKRIFTDTLEYKNFNQGFLDSQEYFIATGDYFIGLGSTFAPLIAPAPFLFLNPLPICLSIPPKDRRFLNSINPNVDYLYSNVDYYNGFKYGATKKKRKRILQGGVTALGVTATLIYILIRSNSVMYY